MIKLLKNLHGKESLVSLKNTNQTTLSIWVREKQTSQTVELFKWRFTSICWHREWAKTFELFLPTYFSLSKISNIQISIVRCATILLLHRVNRKAWMLRDTSQPKRCNVWLQWLSIICVEQISYNSIQEVTHWPQQPPNYLYLYHQWMFSQVRNVWWSNKFNIYAEFVFNQ